MDVKKTNPCIKCGKERIMLKTWKEYIKNYTGVSLVIYSETVCPDKECQKAVNKILQNQKEKRDAIKHEKESRMLLKRRSIRI